MAGRQGWTGLDRKVRRVRRRKLTEGLMSMPKQSKSAPLPLPAGKSRAHPYIFLALPSFAPPCCTGPPPPFLLASPATLPLLPNLPFFFSFPPSCSHDWVHRPLFPFTCLRDGRVGSGQVMVLEVGCVCVLLCHTCLVLVFGSCPALSCPVLSRQSVSLINQSVGQSGRAVRPSSSWWSGLRSVAWGGRGSIGM